MGGLGGGSCGGDVNGDVKSEGDGGQAEFGAAGLVAEFQGDVLRAERRVCERGDGHAKRHCVLVDVQRRFGKSEFFELALGIDDFAAAEAGGQFGFEIRGDEIVFRFFTGVDVKARTDFHDRGNQKRAAAASGIERSVRLGLHDIAAGRNLRICSGRQGDAQRENGDKDTGDCGFHRVT